jgi:signal transduction histidine kinase
MRPSHPLPPHDQQAVAAERLRILGLMTAGIGHNLNNELNGILPYIEWLLSTYTFEPEVRETLEIIHRSALNATSIVQRITSFARRVPDDSFVAINPNEIIGEAVLLARHRWKDGATQPANDIEIKTIFAPVPCILGSLADLHGVLTNLIINAVDAMPQGGTLTLRTLTLTNAEKQALGQAGMMASTRARDVLPAPPCWVAIEVADTGLGMSENVKQRLFEPFFSTKGTNGTGLGLSTSYSIISHHNGDILVHTQEGQGTTFTVLLPAVDAD